MPAPYTFTGAASQSSDHARRRRIATACTTCRNRRVKCDRSRPICLRCTAGGRSCEYISTPTPGIEFVEPFLQGVGAPPTSSETWKSVIEQQVALVDQSKLGKGPSQEIPFWALAESGEGTLAADSRGTQPINKDNQHAGHTILPYSHVQIGDLGGEYLSALWIKLPSQEVCRPYFESFITSIHTVIPICHSPTPTQLYSEFWENLSLATSAELLLLILAMLHTGSANATPCESNGHSLPLLELYNELERAFDISTYYITSSPTSLMILQGILIMNTFRASYHAPFTAYGFLPLAIRFAQALRLHIDSKKTEDQEVRRRLWWHLIFLDVESTIASGLPAIIRSGGHTVQIPSLLSDSTAIGGQPNSQLAMMAAMQGHWQWANHMQIWYEKKPEQHEIIQFGQIIEHLLETIKEARDSEWARIYLKMLIDRAYCMLGLRFWQLEQFGGTSCHSEVVRTSRSFLKNYLELANLSVSPGFGWFSQGLIQPIHALIILLMHLDGCVHPAEESQLSKDLIDQIFDLRTSRILSGNYRTSTSLGFMAGHCNCLRQYNSRYRALTTLKKRVWQKFGWPTPIYHPQNIVDGAPSANDPPESKGSQAVVSLVTTNDHRPEDESISALWDDFTTTAPLDIPNWDEWDSLTAGFFSDMK